MSNYEIIPVSGAGLATVNSIGPDELSIVESFEALEFEFDESVDKASHLDYGVAAGSGLITGLLSIFLGKPLSVEEAAKIGGKEADKIVVNAARSFGCKLPDDKAIFDKDGRCDTEVLSKAIKFLEEKFPIPQDKLTPDYGGGLQHHLRDFSHHPTVLGLFFPSSVNLRALDTALTPTAISLKPSFQRMHSWARTSRKRSRSEPSIGFST